MRSFTLAMLWPFKQDNYFLVIIWSLYLYEVHCNSACNKDGISIVCAQHNHVFELLIFTYFLVHFALSEFEEEFIFWLCWIKWSQSCFNFLWSWWLWSMSTHIRAILSLCSNEKSCKGAWLFSHINKIVFKTVSQNYQYIHFTCCTLHIWDTSVNAEKIFSGQASIDAAFWRIASWSQINVPIMGLVLFIIWIRKYFTKSIKFSMLQELAIAL